MSSVLEQANPIHDFLLSPEAYPEHPKEVECRETHISWVYLTDRYVYKQKKPVRFEFLDFSTLDKRKCFCEQEVMLNQRFSPDVYLGVVPVSSDGAKTYRLEPGPLTVEWLVKMKRLDDDATLEHLTRTDQLTGQQVKRLADHLTDFYSAQAPAMVRSSEFMSRLRGHIIANRNDLLISLPDAEADVRFVTSAQLRCLTLHRDKFIQRVADGRVVDGHGDLRPDHIYFRQTTPQIIDCIEFNAEYRINDVVDELAFLSLECDKLGRRAIGNAVLTAYEKSGADQFPSFLVAFYKCYRACVRAKVCALRAAQASGPVRQECLRDARVYLGLAREYSTLFGKKIAILVGGLSGTGKTTLTTALEEPLAAEPLHTDVLRSELYAPEAESNGKYSSNGRRVVYDKMIELMESSLSRSPTLILDGTFASNAIRSKAIERANQLGAVALQVQCECPTPEARDRITSRVAAGNSESEATLDVHSRQEQEYEPPLSQHPLITVNTETRDRSQVEAVLKAVRQQVEPSRPSVLG